MHLVVATPLYPPESGGPATYAKLIEDTLPEEGITVTLISFTRVRHLPKLIRHFSYYRLVKEALRDADAVLALDPISVGLPAMQAAIECKKPFFVKIVGDYAWEQGVQRFGITDSLDTFVSRTHVPFAVSVLRRIQTRVALRATRVIVPSHYLQGIIEAWGIPKERIAVIYNALQKEQPGTIPEMLHGAPHPWVVSVGRLVPWKGMRGVIDAVSHIPNAPTLIIVGDGPERSSLESYAKKIYPNTLFTGALSPAQVLAVMKEAQVFVLNSTYEGLSHVLIEALSLKVPIVATRTGGNPELVPNEYLVEVGDTKALTEKITRTLEHPVPVLTTIDFSEKTMVHTLARLLTTSL